MRNLSLNANWRPKTRNTIYYDKINTTHYADSLQILISFQEIHRNLVYSESIWDLQNNVKFNI